MTHDPGDQGAGQPSGAIQSGGVADFDAVATMVGEGVYRLDSEGRFVDVNDVVVDITGYSRDELIGEHVSLVLGEEDVEAFEERISALYEAEDRHVGDYVFEMETEAGEAIVCEVRFSVLRADGRFVGSAGIVRDITDRRRELEALEHQRAQLRSALDDALDRVSDAFFALDTDGRFDYVNDRAAELLGRHREELLGQPIEVALPGGSETAFVETLLAAIGTEEADSFEEFFEPLATWFEVRLYPSDTGVSVYFRDVTDRKRHEAVQEQYETVVEAVDDGLYALDDNHRFLFVNDAYCEMTGYSREALIGSHISTVVDEDTVIEAEQRRELLVATEGSSGSAEVELDLPDGRTLTVESNYSMVTGPNGEFRGTVGVVRDITDRKAFEQTLSALHEASRELHDSETADDVARVILRTLTDVLDLSAATLFRHDPDADQMVPEHQTVGASATDQDLPAFPAGEGSLTGHVFELGEFRAYDDIRATPYVDEPATEMRSGLYAPIGEDRILVVSSTEPGAFDERTEHLVELLAGNATAALSRQARERKLRESERRYRTLVEHFPNGAVALFDDDLRISAIGGDVYEEFDIPLEDAEGVSIEERLPPGVFSELEPSLRGALAGESDTLEIRARDRDFWVHTLPIQDDGEVLAGVVMAQDITERKQRERELDRNKTAVDTASDAIITIDEESVIQATNPAVEEVFGYDPDELVGEPLTVLMSDEMAERHREAFERYLVTGETHVEWEYVELPGRHKEGHEIPLAISFGEFEHDGERFFTGIIRDNTDRKERERQLERFERIVETVDDGVYVIDDDGEFVLVNQGLVDMTEYSRDDLIGAHASVVFGERFEEFDDEMSRELRSGDRGLADFEDVLTTADGEEIAVESRFAFFDTDTETATDDGGGRVGVVRDISQRKAYERELERFRTIVEQVNDGVYTIDSEGYITMVNAAYAEMTGYHRAELIGMHGSELVDEEVHEQARAIEAELQESGASQTRLVADLRTADGGTVTAEATFALLPGEEQYERVAVVRDITERVEREQELERALDLLDKAQEIADVGGWELDPETLDVYWSEQIFDLLGIPYGEEPPLEDALDVYHPDDQPVVEDAIEGALESGEPFDIEVRFFKDDGEQHWARIWGVPELVDDEVVSLRGAFQNVTERVERERDLKQYEILFEESTDVNAVLDPDGTFRYLTPSVTSVLGYEPDELVGEIAFDYIHPDDREEAMEEFATLVEDPEHSPGVELRFRHRDGSWVYLDARASNLLDDPDIEGIVAYTRDISELKEREQELRTLFERQEAITDLGRRALEEPDMDELFDEAVEVVVNVLDNEYAKVLELQPDGESLLLRSGVGWRDGLVGRATVGTGDDSQAGHTIRSEEPIVVTDLSTETRFSGPELLTSHGVKSGISTVIGPFEDPWGVLGTHDTERREFDRNDVNFIESVATILATAINRADREREILDQRNQMAAIVRLTEVVQEIHQAVIGQSTRQEIDELVCDRLTQTEDYAAALLGEVNVAGGTITTRAAAGMPDDVLDSISRHQADDSPTAAAIETGSIQVLQAPIDPPAGDGDGEREGGEPEKGGRFPAYAAESGYRSMAAIPITFEDIRYGVLTLFSRRSDAFEGYEARILAQLGDTIGHAINAIDRKQALLSDSHTELDLRLPDTIDTLSLPAESDYSISVDGTVPAGDGTVVQYVRVTGLDPDTFRNAALDLPGATDVGLIGDPPEEADAGGEHRFEITYDDPPISATLAHYGGRIESVSFDVPDLRIVVAIPRSTDVRKVVDAIRSEFPGVQIDAQRTVTRDPDDLEAQKRTMEETLTERQRAALMTAFFAGYFEWSRESTGEDVAETLGVSPSTFHQHLRAAQRKVFSSLFTDNTTT